MVKYVAADKLIIVKKKIKRRNVKKHGLAERKGEQSAVDFGASTTVSSIETTIKDGCGINGVNCCANAVFCFCKIKKMPHGTDS